MIQMSERMGGKKESEQNERSECVNEIQQK
jgi:hypothetical protein